MEKKKKRFGDRFDATLVREIDGMHAIVPYLYPNRADNEAFIQETIDITNLNAYLEKKNEGLDKKHRYTLFHCIACALIKTITLRPKMNYFIQHKKLYARDELTLAFVVKKYFGDDAEEALAFLSFEPDTTIDTFHDKIMKEIFECRRTDKVDNSTAGMDFMKKIPSGILRLVMYIIRRLDYFGKVPRSLVKTDPNYSTVFMSNLGSIGLNAAYHHLNNWGTNSIFVVVGKKHIAPVFHEDGTYDMRECLNLGLTLDERIADGYYYSRSIAILKHILEHPELLDRPANEEITL